MSSQNIERGKFTYAESSPEPLEYATAQKRTANVYDAVAGSYDNCPIEDSQV